jgi:Zn finger protein HypA/HybF involved in hydrogenase expression
MNEREIMQAMATATPERRAQLLGELNQWRIAERKRLRDESDQARGQAFVAHLAAETPRMHHTAQTDWIARVAATERPDGELTTMARDEAQRWLATKSRLVLSDSTETSVQAGGYARRWASQFGSGMSTAHDAFIQRVAVVTGFNVQAEMMEHEDYLEQDRADRASAEADQKAQKMPSLAARTTWITDDTNDAGPNCPNCGSGNVNVPRDDPQGSTDTLFCSNCKTTFDASEGVDQASGQRLLRDGTPNSRFGSRKTAITWDELQEEIRNKPAPGPIDDDTFTFTLAPDDDRWIGNFTDRALNAMISFWGSPEGQSVQKNIPGYADATLKLLNDEKIRRGGSRRTADLWTLSPEDLQAEQASVEARYVGQRFKDVITGVEGTAIAAKANVFGGNPELTIQWDDGTVSTEGLASILSGWPGKVSSSKTASPRDRFSCQSCGWIGERHEIVRPDDLTIACPVCGSNNLMGAGRVASKTAADSDPMVILRVLNTNRSLEEVQAYMYSPWHASQIEDGTIFISGHDDGGGFGLQAQRDRLLSGLIGTEIWDSNAGGTGAVGGRPVGYVGSKMAGIVTIFDESEGYSIKEQVDFLNSGTSAEEAIRQVVDANPMFCSVGGWAEVNDVRYNWTRMDNGGGPVEVKVGLESFASKTADANVVNAEGGITLECYSCGLMGDYDTFGIPTKCPKCGSYEIHLPEAGANWEQALKNYDVNGNRIGSKTAGPADSNQSDAFWDMQSAHSGRIYAAIEQWCDGQGLVMKDFPDSLIDEAVASGGDTRGLEDWLVHNEPRTSGQGKDWDFGVSESASYGWTGSKTAAAGDVEATTDGRGQQKWIVWETMNNQAGYFDSPEDAAAYYADYVAGHQFTMPAPGTVSDGWTMGQPWEPSPGVARPTGALGSYDDTVDHLHDYSSMANDFRCSVCGAPATKYAYQDGARASGFFACDAHVGQFAEGRIVVDAARKTAGAYDQYRWQYMDPDGTGRGWFSDEQKASFPAGEFEEGASWREVSDDERGSASRWYADQLYQQSSRRTAADYTSPISEDRRRELCSATVTLNGRPAKISGVKNNFATVTDLASGMSAEWSWQAVDHVVSGGGRFTSSKTAADGWFGSPEHRQLIQDLIDTYGGYGDMVDPTVDKVLVDLEEGNRGGGYEDEGTNSVWGRTRASKMAAVTGNRRTAVLTIGKESMRIVIDEDVADEAAMADLLEEIAQQLEGGNTSGYYPTWHLASRGPRRTAADGMKCSECGASIERDPEGEANRTWHHNDGKSHDHEAKPSKEAAASRKCTYCGKRITFGDGQWQDSSTGTDCDKSTVGHKPGVKESSRRTAGDASWYTKAYREGLAAGDQGDGIQYNPYPIFGAEAEQWIMGYRDAQGLQPGSKASSRTAAKIPARAEYLINWLDNNTNEKNDDDQVQELSEILSGVGLTWAYGTGDRVKVITPTQMEQVVEQYGSGWDGASERRDAISKLPDARTAGLTSRKTGAFSNADEIKAAVDAGQSVKWSNDGYDVIKDSLGQYMIVYYGGDAIGLTWQDGQTLNGDPGEFYVAGSRTASRRTAYRQVSVQDLQPGDVLLTEPGGTYDPANNTVLSVDGFSGMWIIDFTNGQSTPPLGNGMVFVAALENPLSPTLNENVGVGEATDDFNLGWVDEGGEPYEPDDDMGLEVKKDASLRIAERSMSEIGEAINAQDFDHCFTLHPDGTITDAPGVYAPSVYHSETNDIDIDGSGWSALTGLTGQDSYSGAVMHASEYIGSGVAEVMMDMVADGPMVFVITTVEVMPEDDDDEPEPAGWAILYKKGRTGSRKRAYTDDESDVSNLGKLLMKITNEETDKLGGDQAWNYGGDSVRKAVEDAIMNRLISTRLIDDITDVEQDALEDYNYHVTNRAIDRAKGNTRYSSRRTAAGDSSDAYPNGKCGACGQGANSKGKCTNRSCSNYGQVVTGSRTAAEWSDEFLENESEGPHDDATLSIQPGTGTPADDTAMFEPGEIEGDWDKIAQATARKMANVRTQADDDHSLFEAGTMHTAMPSPIDAGINVGDVFYNSWGYDQTNIDYYEVIRLTPSGVEIRPIQSTFVEQNGPGGNKVVPAKGQWRTFDVITGIGTNGNGKTTKVCRIKDWGDGPRIVLSSDYSAGRWKGGAMYETDSMFGH